MNPRERFKDAVFNVRMAILLLLRLPRNLLEHYCYFTTKMVTFSAI